MKQNVDLTANRDFRKSVNLTKLTHSLLGFNYPWDETVKCYPYRDTDMEIVFTGTRNERQKKMKWIPYEDGLECEMCGINHSNTPWNMALTLCQKCDDLLEREHLNKNDLILNVMNKTIN